MKRILALILAALMLAAALTLVACGNKETEKEEEKEETKEDTPATDVDLAKLESDIAAYFGEKYMLSYLNEDGTDSCTIDEETITLCETFDLTQVDAYVAKEAAVSAIHKDAMYLLKCKDGYADTAVAKFNEIYANTYSYRGYATSYEILKTEYARLYKIGNYVLYIVTGADDDGTLDDDAAAAAMQADYDAIDGIIKAAFNVSTLENLAVKPEIDDSEEQGGAVGGLGGFGGLIIPDIEGEGETDGATDGE